MHNVTSATMAAHLPKSLGSFFDPDMHQDTHDQIANVLVKQVTDFTKNEISHAIYQGFKNFRFPLPWDKFICHVLGQLPGRWTRLTNDPGINASTMFLLTDGTVLCQAANDSRWRKLTPDIHGSYINGTWDDISPSNDKRLYYASAVLSDGRLIVCGGEYAGGGAVWSNKTEIYDPVADTWTEILPPTGWANVGDSPSVLLPDGRLFIGKYNERKTAIYDPVANTWTAGPDKPTTSSEESWVLLPDNTVITVRCNSSMQADKYVIATNSWVDGGTLPQGIIETSSSEIGGAVTLPNGKAFFVGANGHTALYTPPLNPSDTGTWSQGPDFPAGPNGETIGSKDAAACLLTNGRVLIVAGPVDGHSWLTPTYFYEYNGTSIKRVADPTNNSKEPYQGRTLLLPNGQVLFASASNEIYAYSYFACPVDAWRPVIVSAPHTVRALFTYSITGAQFNGLSQAVGYGDDAASATNYPLVRLRNKKNGQIYYCRTFDHSTMGIATGTAIESTQFQVPFGVPKGSYELYVVANGIPSLPVDLDVEDWRFPFPLDERMWNFLIGSLADGPLWVITKNGPHPVDPWGPEYIKQARKATDQIVEGLRSLKQLGDHLFNEQINKLAQNPAPIPDEADEDEEDEKIDKKDKKKMLVES